MATILLAEDDTSMRHFLTAALERAGHKVTPCMNGLEAIKEIELGVKDYDLLLADIVMPGMDGIELSKRVSDLVPGIRVVFITGFAGVAMGHSAEAQTHARILSKPFHLNEIVQQVDVVLSD